MNLPNSNDTSFFHAYDVRGKYPEELNIIVAYKVACAYFAMVQGERFVIGYDMRESSPDLFNGFVRAANDLGKRIDNLGMVTTDNLYFALGKYDYDGGIMITASHNPKIYNGIKMMGKGVDPIDMEEIKRIYQEQNTQVPSDISTKTVDFHDVNYADEYVDHVLSFVNKDKIGKFKLIVDAGNGLGGQNAQQVFDRLPQLEILPMYFEPSANFPHHESNPATADNTKELAHAVVDKKADLGIAFDGDGDRCYFVDEKGDYIPSYLIVAILAKIFLNKEPGSKIAFDYRNIYAIRHEISEGKGEELPVKAGHSFFKDIMRENKALFGGESSGHFYFRDNYYADNGAVPFLMILEYLTAENKTFSEILSYYRSEFFSSGEMNFLVNEGVDPNAIYEKFKQTFHRGNISEPDGLVMEFESWRFNARMSNTEPKMRINVEATSHVQLEESVVDIHEVMSHFGVFLGNQSAADINLSTEDKFNLLLDNLWFTWNSHYIMPVIDLYGDGWRKNSPPGEFASQYGRKRLERVLDQKSWEIDQNLRLFREYMNKDNKTWFDKFITDPKNKAFKQLKSNPIAYFSLEYGLVDWLQIYSGGLGVLAGDFIKQASDMGIPMVAMGIFYHQGYFHQDFDEEGGQIETYISQNPEDYHMELVKDEQGNPIHITVEIVDHEVWVRAWKLKVGKVDLLLLDTNFDKNEKYEDKMITAHLYGGDQDTRIRQEILLGIGGPRILKTMEVEPTIFHMNEGHSGFLVIEVARNYIEEEGMSFEEAINKVDDKLVFTNHTLKQAGNDIFSYSLIEKFFGTYLDNLKTDLNNVFNLGKDELYAQGEFSMTLLGLRNAKVSNAVSILHGQAAKKLWPDYNLVAVTNGVHMPTWVSPEIHKLLDRYLGENWHFPEADRKVNIADIQNIPHEELWNAHMTRKEKLINSLNNELNLSLTPNALTIAWSRRLASYKRPDLIISDIERIRQIVGNAEQPVQILISGKAHPRDGVGKELVKNMNQQLSHPDFKNKVVIIPGYNWQLARRIVSGADVWLNTPYRFEEASGTSGMKAAANGVLQLTTKDGWTDEVDWYQKGWVIDEENAALSLYDTLEHKVRDLYFNKDTNGYNKHWVEMMLNCIETVLYQYSTERMMIEYLDKIYQQVLE